MITLLYHIIEHLVFVKKHVLLKHLKKLIDTITLIGTDKKGNTTSYYTNGDFMSTTHTQNEITSLNNRIKECAQCEQNKYSTKCFLLPGQMSEELHFFYMRKQQQQ